MLELNATSTAVDGFYAGKLLQTSLKIVVLLYSLQCLAGQVIYYMH